jgi:hypothetical protein
VSEVESRGELVFRQAGGEEKNQKTAKKLALETQAHYASLHAPSMQQLSGKLAADCMLHAFFTHNGRTSTGSQPEHLPVDGSNGLLSAPSEFN